MIHSHYDSEQILWFVRNYWKYTRENMIQEFRRTFHDSNFAKSQYQWLKTRYGMKEEWGASLNNPPYSGARPGGPGTETYEPPDIPAHAPQMIFRTRSDSPTPSLVHAPPPAPMESGGQAHTTSARNRVSSGSGSLRVVPPDSCAYSDGATRSTAQTPTHTAAGTPSFPTSNLASGGTYPVPEQISPLATNGLNGTYMFGLPQSLGSPFVPAAVQMGSFNANTATHAANMATLNASYPMPTSAYGTNPSAGISSFLRTENHTVTNGQQQTNYLTGQPVGGNADHMLLATYPFATTQPFQLAGGQYGGTFHGQAASDNIIQQHALTGLGIDNQNHLGQQGRQGLSSDSSASGLSALTNIGNLMAASSMNTNAYRSMGISGGNDHYPLPESHAGSPSPSRHGPMETIVSPHGPMTPLSKRKRKLVEVECRPPTLTTLLDPALQVARDSGGISPASPRVVAAAQVHAHGGATPLKKQKSAKSSVAAGSPSIATIAVPEPAGNAAATVKHGPSSHTANSPKTPVVTSTPVSSHAGGSAAGGSGVHAASNPDALPFSSQSTELVRRVPEAPTIQAQLGSIALAQIMGMRAGNASAAAYAPPGKGALVLRDFAAHSQLQTPNSSRTNSFVMPVNSRPASRNTAYPSSPPSIAVSPNRRGSGASGHIGWTRMPVSTGEGNLSHAANCIKSAAPADASTMASAAASLDAASSAHVAGTHSSALHDFDYGDYDAIDFAGSSDDLGPMLNQDMAGSASSFNEAMDRLLFGDSFPGEINVPVDQSSAAANNQPSSAAETHSSDVAENPPSMPAKLENSSSHSSDEAQDSRHGEGSGGPFSPPGGEPWFES